VVEAERKERAEHTGRSQSLIVGRLTVVCCSRLCKRPFTGGIIFSFRVTAAARVCVRWGISNERTREGTTMMGYGVEMLSDQSVKDTSQKGR
jgi:hypothetical protein